MLIAWWLVMVGLLAAIWRLTDYRREIIRLRCALEVERSLRVKWCSVCGTIYDVHPGRQSTSPEYTLACPTGKWLQE